jgi:hypothetical protein
LLNWIPSAKGNINFALDLSLQAIVNGLPNFPTALEKKSFEVQEQLATFPVVGIVGMGGIGKSTIAKEVFNTICVQYEFTCFVEDVKGIKPHKLDDWLRSHFLRSGSKPDGVIQWRQLEGKKTLIVLDDVDSENQFKVLPKLGELGDGSSFIITTRNSALLNHFANFHIYEVGFLHLQEAKKLLCHHAFGQDRVPESLIESYPFLTDLVQKVLQKCDGLPLTLEVMRCHLKDYQSDAMAWKQTIDVLSKAESLDGSCESRLWTSLELSYNMLGEEEKQMFLEAATIFFKKRVEKVLWGWSTTYSCSQMRWTNLMKKSLVKEVVTYKFDGSGMKISRKEIWVHEQLRDLAIHLSEGAIISHQFASGDLERSLHEANVVSSK